jgi:hypothetical protein
MVAFDFRVKRSETITISWFFEGGGSGARNFQILIFRTGAHANRADGLAIDTERDAAANRSLRGRTREREAERQNDIRLIA